MSAGSCSLWRGGWRRGPESSWTFGYRPSCHGRDTTLRGTGRARCQSVSLFYRMNLITGSITPLARLTRDKSRKIKNNKEETENNFNTTSVTSSITETALDSIVSLEVSRPTGHNIWLHISFHVLSVYSSKQTPPFPLGTDREFLTRISIHLSHSNCIQLCFFTLEIEKHQIVGIFSPDFKIYIFFADLVTFQTRVKTSPILIFLDIPQQQWCFLIAGECEGFVIVYYCLRI